MAVAERTPVETAPKQSAKERLQAAVVSLRGWVAENRRQAMLFAGAGAITLFCTIASLYVIVAYWGGEEEKVTAQTALDLLDAAMYPEAIEVGQKLRAKKDLSYEDAGLVSYVLGVASALETDERWEKDKTRSYLLSSRFLEEARDRGFLTDRAAEGTYQLARCQFLSGQYREARQNLLAALKLNPTRSSELYRMLATAALNEANPRLDRALEYNAKYLAGKLLSNAARQAAWIERAQILFRQGKMEECRTALTNIPDNSKLRGEAIVLAGRMLMDRAERLARVAPAGKDSSEKEESEKLYEQAIETFRQAQSQDTLKAQATPKAMYLIGECWLQLGRPDEALAQLDRTRQLYNELPESLVAGLSAADILSEQGREKEAVAAYRREFARAGTPETFSNPWLTLDAFRARMLSAYRRLVARHKFEASLELLEGFRPIFTKAEMTELQAQTNRNWADKLEAQAELTKLPQSRHLKQQAARQYRHAGMEYLELARLRLSAREYPDDVWDSADNLLRGRDYPLAVRTLREYLKIELRKRRPQALVALGRATLTIGEIDDSIQAFQEVMEYHAADAAVFEARFWCSKAYQEKGELDKAEDLLRLNLTGDTLTPASLEWRDSLFELGRLLNGVGKYQEAIGYLNEAIARYPQVDQAIEAQYLVAESYREAARVPLDRLKSAEIESVRVAQTKEMRDLLEGALQNYKAVLEILNRREEASPLSEHEAAMLRNSYFAIGSVLFDMGRFQESIKAYSNASTRYQNEPLVLEAFVQIANCHRRLGKDLEARGAIEQAKVVWKRLPTKVDYTKTTNHTRDEWQKLLDLLGSW
jgi:tetratricopeptide (TPR) repeat protein